MNLIPNKQSLLDVPFQSNKYKKKELSVDKKLRDTIGDVYCPTCRNKKCVYISTKKKRPVSATVKSVKPAATFWCFLLRTKNRQLCCLEVMVHIDCKNNDL